MSQQLDPKYLISGPAPLGRILNYIKRIKNNQFTTSIRGKVEDPNNLDNWTVDFMVGLGLIKIPTKSGKVLKIALTEEGLRIYELIKNLPDFSDPFKQDHHKNMIDIKNSLLATNLDLYAVGKSGWDNQAHQPAHASPLV
ncbi:MAG: hypothetical protein N2692_03035 [Patescibacteria group bacterium]|nr:hypothetical protein [Patescibacteria group bacterium]